MQDARGNPSLLNSAVLADSSYRLSQFRTRTILVRDWGRNVVDKVATTYEARTFLGLIPDKERENVGYLHGHFDVLCGNRREERIVYEYLPQPSVAESIGFELNSGHCNKADELLDLYVHKIHALEHRPHYPSEFLSQIVGDSRGDDDLVVDCLSRGPLDLTLRNILLDGDRWVVIDNEWSFPFPIPVAFLLFRAVRQLCMMWQPEIRRTTGTDRPAVGLLTTRLRTYYFPKSWIEYCKAPHVSFMQMLRWEAGFRRYVAGPACRSPGRVRLWPRETTHPPLLPRESNGGAVEGMRRVLQAVPGAKRVAHFTEQMLLNWRK
jgi:hypothetical protein